MKILSKISSLILFACLIGYQAGASQDPIDTGTVFVQGNIVTSINRETEFFGEAFSPQAPIARYQWDFNGDGSVDWETEKKETARHTFTRVGNYTARFVAENEWGQVLPEKLVKVVVKSDDTGQETVNAKTDSDVIENLNLTQEEKKFLGLETSGGLVPQWIPENDGPIPPDGNPHKYAVIFNGSSEQRFWDDVLSYYDMFNVEYSMPAADIYLLNYDGTAPGGTNPNGMIDDNAAPSTFSATMTTMSSFVDQDDLVFVVILDHGNGYRGPGDIYYGYLGSPADVDLGDEEDYLESNFKLRSFVITDNDPENAGMNRWYNYKKLITLGSWDYYRIRYESHFTDWNTIQQGTISDNDIFIEVFMDYLVCDLNANGNMNESEGEQALISHLYGYDCDGDGIPAYNVDTGVFDEDDWGVIDTMSIDDHSNGINSRLPGNLMSERLLDIGLDNHLDVDFSYNLASPEADATDTDNNGLFDGIDVNEDGDMNDWVSIDETVVHPAVEDEFTDDLWDSYLDLISPQVLIVNSNTCYSGGIIEDLSGQNRILFTASGEEEPSSGNIFARNVASALAGKLYDGAGGTITQADANQDGYVSMTETFNYATNNGYTTQDITQYDDNADHHSFIYPIPQGGDGFLGSIVNLTSWSTDTSGLDPLIEINDPEDGGVITGDTDNINVTASGSTGLSAIEIYIDDVLVDSVNNPSQLVSHDFSWDSESVPGGTQVELKAVAQDLYSNTSQQTINVYAGYEPTTTATPTATPAGGTYSSTQSVTLSTTTSGATIYYTTNGDTPTTGSTPYTSAVSVSEGMTLKAIATKAGMDNSSVMSETYIIGTAAAPTASPDGGNYISVAAVILSTATSGATIYYTTNGDTPTAGSSPYTGAIDISHTMTLKAIAVKAGMQNSPVMEKNYTIKAATPTATPAGGTYSSTQSVTLSTTTSGATIYYTTNGDTPTTGSTPYTSAVSVSEGMTLKAIAAKAGMDNSSVMSETYVIGTAAAPTASPASGTYSSIQSVILSTTTSGATIYYTTNGDTPTTSSARYSLPIGLSPDGTYIIKAIAAKVGMANSSVMDATYVLDDQSDAVVSINSAGVSNKTKNSAEIAVYTSVPTNVTISYSAKKKKNKRTKKYYLAGARSVSDNETKISHIISIPGLKKKKKYFYQIVARNADSTNTADTSIRSFKTKSK